MPAISARRILIYFFKYLDIRVRSHTWYYAYLHSDRDTTLLYVGVCTSICLPSCLVRLNNILSTVGLTGLEPYAIDNCGHPRSRRWASSRRGEKKLVRRCVIPPYLPSVTIMSKPIEKHAHIDSVLSHPPTLMQTHQEYRETQRRATDQSNHRDHEHLKHRIVVAL